MVERTLRRDRHLRGPQRRLAYTRRSIGVWLGVWTCAAALSFSPNVDPTVRLTVGSLESAEPAGTSGGGVDYQRDVKPILKQRCYACHGALKQESNLRLDTVDSILKGGDDGPAIAAGKTSDSHLVQRITASDALLRMPPEGAPLAAEQIDKIRKWIEQGAPKPAGESPEPDPRAHWAFRPPVKGELPRRSDGTTAAHPVDAFLLARLDTAALSPRPLADKATLLRRAYFDLIGLPPTRDELLAFLADDSPGAYAAMVDRLLNDPRYGERWGRHWMDVWRYADWYGRRHVPDVWNSAPQIWRWRDWIVRSLNEDHGYDRMVREMLAADEIAPDDPSAAAATGYLVRNWYALNPNDWMRANVEHTSKAFLGLTFHCAHCHDHKYDPIKQDDYFRLRAMFEPIGLRQDRVAGEADPGPFQEYSYGVLRKIQRLGVVQVFDKNPTAPTWYYTGGDERNRVAERGSMAPGLPAFLGGGLKVEPLQLPASAWYPGLRPELIETLVGEQRAIIESSEKQLATVRAEVDAARPALLEKLAAAEAELAAAMNDAAAKSAGGALVGKQSLLLNATTGRRAVQNGLAGLKSLDSGTTISFELKIIQDAHVNFQLARDVVAGLTAGFVGFEKGRILAYQPGGFTEFQAGAYDAARPQPRFHVSLMIEPAADRCLLTVVQRADSMTMPIAATDAPSGERKTESTKTESTNNEAQGDRVLVDKLPVALNSWNPVGDPKKAISFDARPGTVAAVDDVRVIAPAAADGARMTLIESGFEPPAFVEQRDIGGVGGWQVSQFSQAPATSIVTSVLGTDSFAALRDKVRLARRAVDSQTLRVAALEGKAGAARAEIAGIEARAAAERSKLRQPPDGQFETLATVASTRHREAALKKSQAEVLTHDQSLAASEIKPATDANRAKEVDAAGKALAAARAAADKAQAALTDPQQATAYPTLGPTYSATSTGRRKALATWITGRDNPLTARVAVNHVWLRHFHSPLVASVFDFGQNGARPTHPELLDWLAVELMDSGWSMKRLHRLIMTSEAYRRTSAAGDVERYSSDPENKLLWRMNTGRMESEVVRDSLLYVAGKLDLQQGGQELENSLALTTFRRTLYYSCQPEIDGKNMFSALFDAPEPADCYRRTRSVVPQQSLALANSELVHEASVALAAALWAKLTPAQQADSGLFVEAAFEQILNRRPTSAESAACVEFLRSGGAADTVPTREGLVRALLNHNDFITIR